MKLKNFNWDEHAIDQTISEDSRYTTYTAYGTHDYYIDFAPQTSFTAEGETKREELTIL